LSGKTAKAAGKTGERRVKQYLESRGWFIADRETQGLAGDDLFAQDPNGDWWSIEVKNTRIFPAEKYYGQAIRQARERVEAVRDALRASTSSVLKRLGVTYPKPNFLLVWTPTGVDNGKDFIVLRRKDGKTTFEIWES
jgi:Holliday junction resolvase-like predicted endonuclease